MHLTFILHFDASKEADVSATTERIQQIHKFCQDNKHNLLIRTEFYHDAAWKWSDQTLKLAYDYLWGDFNCEDNKIDGAVIVYLTSDLEAVEASLKEDASQAEWTVVMDTHSIHVVRNQAAKETLELLLQKAAQ